MQHKKLTEKYIKILDNSKSYTNKNGYNLQNFIAFTKLEVLNEDFLAI
jgi:hypothetical protein